MRKARVRCPTRNMFFRKKEISAKTTAENKPVGIFYNGNHKEQKGQKVKRGKKEKMRGG